MSPADEIEQVSRRAPTRAGTRGWWERYESSLARSNIPETSRHVIEADSRYIVERGVLGAGHAGDRRWPDGRVRRGLVMGAVQSGKTASMLGVTALCLDARVDMVVVLAGTRVSLWRQTIERLGQQLDWADAGSDAERAGLRLLVPSREASASDDPSQTPARLYDMSRPQLQRAVRSRRPIIATALKNAHHLRALAKVLRERLVPVIEQEGRPFHLLVVDDEADDGSILDARIEQRINPATQDLKQIPRAIVDLWARRPHTGESASPVLFATYVGYTATPQANFLQSDHNPLAPTDFAIALRTPAQHGELVPRETTYSEKGGLAAYYTGGEAFYHRPIDAPLCRPTTTDPDADLQDALRAFLISGAIRLWRAEDGPLPSEAREGRFATREEAKAGSPKPHSMLFHPSATIADHFAAAAAVLHAACGLTVEQSDARISAGERGLPVDALAARIHAEEPAWQQWLTSFRTTATAIEKAYDVAQPRRLPDLTDWPAIRSLVLEEIAPATKIKIVNSDPAADDRPQFEPVGSDEQGWEAPPDLCTIFVSGNVMSRGLTLEGLTTTLFLRTSSDPYADTQMQMQRWFGYRGGHLELCRVMLPQDQLGLFRAYHDADEALRRTVLAAMEESDEAPDPIVLQGLDFSATGKLTNVTNAPLCPGATPFVRHVNSGKAPDPNCGILAKAFAAPSRDVVVRDTLRGRLLDEPMSLLDTAALLDKLRYEHHRPSANGWEGARWRDVATKVGIDPASDQDSVLPFFQPPDDEPTTPYVQGGPYAIAAYLRLWHACLTRHARGLVGTDDPRVLWSVANLAVKQQQAPRFHIGIRYGSGTAIVTGPLGELPFTVTAMRRDVADGQLVASWGTRNPRGDADRYLGDALLDYHVHGQTPPIAQPGEPLWRPAGAPGLLLFHVIEQKERDFPTVAVGVAIPLGGPDQFAARPGNR